MCTQDASGPEGAADVHLDRTIAVFLAAHHHDPALLAPVRAVIARMRAAMAEDGLARGAAAALLAISDGLMAARMFGLYELSATERADLRVAVCGLLATGGAR